MDEAVRASCNFISLFKVRSDALPNLTVEYTFGGGVDNLSLAPPICPRTAAAAAAAAVLVREGLLSRGKSAPSSSALMRSTTVC